MYNFFLQKSFILFKMDYEAFKQLEYINNNHLYQYI